MNYEQFVTKAKELGAENINTEDGSRDDYRRETKNKGTLCFYVTWRTGGERGGSCWDNGDSKHYPVEAEEEPDLDSLEKFLDDVFPDLTRKQYKSITDNIFTNTDWKTENEYYGNYTTYGLKAIKIKDLYEELQKLNLCE